MPTDSLATAADLDAADPLAAYRDRFVGAYTPLVYFDGNSLGRPLASVADRLSAFVREDWGGRLIRGWDERWYDLPLTLGDRLGAVCLGAAPGQTAIGDSTTVWLYKLIRAAVGAQLAADARRTEIVIDTDNFPTDRYVVEGIVDELSHAGVSVRWVEVDRTLGVTPEVLREAVGERSAVVVLSHIAYRSGYIADGVELTRIAHDAGAMICWDLCHSAGSFAVDLDGWGADVAVGCTYKYLNGGPGAPAFGYVAARHQEVLRQPIQGWMGHADPFAMGPGYTPSAGMRRFISGTPPITAMVALEEMVDLLEETGIDAVREKSIGLTTYAFDLASERLAPLGVTITSPRDPMIRGGHVSLNHSRMREVVAALWEIDVIPDYREPGDLRVGLSPLSTSYAEVEAGVTAIREALER